MQNYIEMYLQVGKKSTTIPHQILHPPFQTFLFKLQTPLLTIINTNFLCLQYLYNFCDYLHVINRQKLPWIFWVTQTYSYSNPVRLKYSPLNIHKYAPHLGAHTFGIDWIWKEAEAQNLQWWKGPSIIHNTFSYRKMKHTFELMVDFQRVQPEQVVINVRQVRVAAAVEHRSPNGRRKLLLLLDYLRGCARGRPCNTTQTQLKLGRSWPSSCMLVENSFARERRFALYRMAIRNLSLGRRTHVFCYRHSMNQFYW